MNIEQQMPKNYPLIEKCLGDYIRRLLACPPEGGRAVHLFSRGDPERLEKQLQRTHKTIAFRTIFREIGSIKDPDELDRRLVDAWAEIRVIDQLMRERFIDIRKVEVAADLVARSVSQVYAVQVKRISREAEFSDLPIGEAESIYGQQRDPIWSYFRDSLVDKNSQLAKFECRCQPRHVRRIAMVTSIDRLRDPMNRHIACRQIKDAILDLPKRHFEEVQWLPDLGNGAIFWIEKTDGEVKIRCVADWRDDPTAPHWGDYGNCCWREVDLDSKLPVYVDQ